MKQNVNRQIQLLQNKYQIHKRFSINSPTKQSRKIKTQTQTQNHSNLTDSQNPLVKSRVQQSQQNYKLKRQNQNSENDRSTLIGKKYFDLSLYKAQSSYREMERSKKRNLNLPKLQSTFETQLYSETVSKRSVNLWNQSTRFGEECSIRKSALQKVQMIYVCEKKVVDEKYEKIMKIKNGLKLLDRISKDKLKLKERIIKLEEQ